MAHKIMVLLGSVRDNRMGENIAKWVMHELNNSDVDCNFELVDLKELELPFVNEPMPAAAGMPYTYEETRRWSEKVKGYDGFIFLVAEYNHGYTAVLKNAIDLLYAEWENKALGLVGYGAGAASYSLPALQQVLDHVKFNTMKNKVQVTLSREDFLDENGFPKKKFIEGSIQELAKELHKAVQ